VKQVILSAKPQPTYLELESRLLNEEMARKQDSSQEREEEALAVTFRSGSRRPFGRGPRNQGGKHGYQYQGAYHQGNYNQDNQGYNNPRGSNNQSSIYQSSHSGGAHAHGAGSSSFSHQQGSRGGFYNSGSDRHNPSPSHWSMRSEPWSTR
jgi:hypothetical protein